MKGRMKKKLRERPTRELTVSELMAHTGSPYYNSRKQSDIKTKYNRIIISKNRKRKKDQAIQ